MTWCDEERSEQVMPLETGARIRHFCIALTVYALVGVRNRRFELTNSAPVFLRTGLHRPSLGLFGAVRVAT